MEAGVCGRFKAGWMEAVIQVGEEERATRLMVIHLGAGHSPQSSFLYLCIWFRPTLSFYKAILSSQ